ncbi:MAG: hypothetical protein A3E78_04020 [Alphaproteobacteria bacterium RIFCSPHIGHO2_12_FULL_63_12]|nr:MAG: hypothetical protein A3E78_04020 [Alphaproteobacteria bacterium RIFCSPHIGHO2_12_FULL_63_12]
MTQPRPFECLGGPVDGETVAFPEGRGEFCVRIGGTWHLYVPQPTDLGVMLVYRGHLAAHQRPTLPASPVR